jgi:hypothetical protein
MLGEGLKVKKAVESAEKTAKFKTLKMIGLTRSSSQEVADGYGPSIQKSEITEDARRQGYQIGCIRDIVEPATLDLEERDLFNEVMAEAIKLKKENLCDGLSFSRCDRLSRRFDAALQIALDCKKNGLAPRFVRENQWRRPDDEPMQFVLFVLQAFGVHTQTGITMANMNAGRRQKGSFRPESVKGCLATPWPTRSSQPTHSSPLLMRYWIGLCAGRASTG